MKRSLIMTALWLGSLSAFASQASAELRVRSCDYDIHTVRQAEIRYDGYFQNPLELRKIAAGVFGAVHNLTDGTYLKIQARIVGADAESGRRSVLTQRRAGEPSANDLEIKAEISQGGFTRVSLSGRAKLKAGHYHMRLARPLTETPDETRFVRVEIVCHVSKETFSDRIFDALER